jgi:myosin-7
MGLSQKFRAEVTAAKAMIEELGFETKLSLQLQTAIKTDDMERIDDLLQQAEQKRIATDEVLAAHTFKKVSNKLEMAVQSADVSALELAIKQADSACEGLDEKWGKLVNYKLRDKVKQAESASNKETLRFNLIQAVEGEDFVALRQALQMVISVNLSGPEVDAAKAKFDEMSKNDDSKSLLESTIKTMEIKLQNTLGVQPGDWDPLDSAIERAQKMGLLEEDPTMRKALKMAKDMKSQHSVRLGLVDAMDKKDFKQLKTMLKEAGELLMSIEVVDQARETFRDMYEARQSARAEGQLDDEDEEDEEEEESILVQQAADSRYHFSNYKNIRGVDEFTKGARVSPRELKTMKEGMLRWQKNPLHKSLLRLGSDPAANKTAVAIHKSILGYMGDKPMAFPAALAQDILNTATNTCRFVDGLPKDSELIADEIYLQLMKQMTENPKPESLARGWQLLCMCVGCFPPTRNFESYLLNFVLLHKEQGGTVGNYASFALRRLEGTLGNSAAYTGFVPDEDDIKAYQV